MKGENLLQTTLHASIGACRPGLFRFMCILISREPDVKTPYMAYACLCVHRHPYSVHCSDKIRFRNFTSNAAWASFAQVLLTQLCRCLYMHASISSHISQFPTQTEQSAVMLPNTTLWFWSSIAAIGNLPDSFLLERSVKVCMARLNRCSWASSGTNPGCGGISPTFIHTPPRWHQRISGERVGCWRWWTWTIAWF